MKFRASTLYNKFKSLGIVMADFEPKTYSKISFLTINWRIPIWFAITLLKDLSNVQLLFHNVYLPNNIKLWF